MAFIRHKFVNGHKYYQVVRNYRENGKHRQEVVLHLGKHTSVESMIEAWKWREEYCRDAASRWFAMAEERREKLLRLYGEELGGSIPDKELVDAKRASSRSRFFPASYRSLWEKVFDYYDLLDDARSYDLDADWYLGEIRRLEEIDASVNKGRGLKLRPEGGSKA